MTEPQAPHEPNWRLWIFFVLFVLSLFPLLLLILLELDEVSQLASALALPLAVLLAVLPTVPPIHGFGHPLLGRRLLVLVAIVVGLLGVIGVTYAIWQNTKDISGAYPSGKLHPSDKPHGSWKHGDHGYLTLPEEFPERDHLTLTALLINDTGFGDCEQTGTLDFAPVLDGRQKESVRAQPGEEVTLLLEGTVREAKVKVTLLYEQGNMNCEVDLYIDEAVLHD